MHPFISVPRTPRLTRDARRANLGASHLILGCRNVTKGEEARTVILRACQLSKPPMVKVWPVDMTSYQSVLAFGRRASSTLSSLDTVILNAGVDYKDFELAEGVESTLTVNVVSTLLLAHLLLPKLRETAEQRNRATHLTFVGSMIHVFAEVDQLCNTKRGEIFETLSDPAQTDMLNRYYLSKLILTLVVRDLAAQFDKSARKTASPVIINDVNPGWCKTGLFRYNELGFAPRIMLRLIGRTGEVGARTLTHAASAGQETHGRYVSECQVKSESTFVRSKEGLSVQEKLGSELREILETIESGVTQQI